MITKKTCEQFNKVLWKIGEHPAMPSILFPLQTSLWFSLQEVCSRGYSNWVTKDGVSIYYNEKNYKKYKSEFDKEFKDNNDDTYPKSLIHISIPYVDYFGEKWKAHHCEYWGEISFYIYQLKEYSFKNSHDTKNWQAYQGFNISSLSYEELVIKACNKFFKIYGNKFRDDFLTDKEKDNHKKERMFLMDRKTKDGRGYYMDRNKKYIDVTDAEINHRWLKEFVKTDYCIKNWNTEFQKLNK